VRAIVQAFLAAALFGAATPASKWLLGELSPQALAGLLYLGAAGATAPSLLRRSAHGTGRRSVADRLRLLGAVGLGGMAGPVLLLEGLRLASAGSVALWLNLEMAFTAALGAWWFRDSLGPRGWLGTAGVVGAGVVVAWGEGGSGVWPAGLVAAACGCWAIDNHLTARIEGITPARAAFWKGAVAGGTNLAIALAVAPVTAGAATIGSALGIGALAYGASVVLYVSAAQQLGATRAQAAFASAPFLGAGLAWAVLGEPIGIAQVLGAALLAGSLLLLLRARHGHQHAHAAVEHVHAHRHDDDHHRHEHPGVRTGAAHTHWHRHEPIVHAHPHWPDLHHRHAHSAQGEPATD